jgi:hypothetical protein
LERSPTEQVAPETLPYPVKDLEAPLRHTLAHYGFKDFKGSADFIEQSQALYARMMQWQRLLGIEPSAERQASLFEKAVLTQALVPLTKQAFCMLSSPLQAQLRSESLALITAKLMQEHGTQYSTQEYLKGAKAIFDTQQKQNKPELFREYQNLHPLASDRTLQLLVDQALVCRNQCNQLLTEKARVTLIEASYHFESLEKQGLVQSAVQTLVQEQSLCFNKESPLTVQKALEHRFMQGMSTEIQSLREARHPAHTERIAEQRSTPSAHLEQATRLTRESHQHIAQQEQAIMKETNKARTLSKDNERER